MSDETKRMLERNFNVRGAGRRGLLWAMGCFILAYFPQVAHALTATSAAIFG